MARNKSEKGPPTPEAAAPDPAQDYIERLRRMIDKQMAADWKTASERVRQKAQKRRERRARLIKKVNKGEL
jgi:hypothetical protein